MGEALPLLTASINASLSVETRPERLTGDAGAILVREVIERTGIVGWHRRVDDRAAARPTAAASRLLSLG